MNFHYTIDLYPITNVTTITLHHKNLNHFNRSNLELTTLYSDPLKHPTAQLCGYIAIKQTTQHIAAENLSKNAVTLLCNSFKK